MNTGIGIGNNDCGMGISAFHRSTVRQLDLEDEGSTPAGSHTAWTAITGSVGAIVGVAPHVLHHAGPLVGSALVAGVGGTALFGFLGLVASIPMLMKLRRRFSNWWAPGIALGLFATMFLISSFVIGPLISGPDEPQTPRGTEIVHSVHHS